MRLYATAAGVCFDGAGKPAVDLKVISDLVKERTVCSLPAGGTAFDAAQKMADCDVAAICVTDGKSNLIGIVTEHDLTRRVIGKCRDPRKTLLGNIMTAKPDTLALGDTAFDALALMQTRGFSHLPVVGKDGTAIGMVSIRDLCALVQRALESNLCKTEAHVFGDRCEI